MSTTLDCEHLVTLAIERQPETDLAALRWSLDGLAALRELMTDDEFQATTKAGGKWQGERSGPPSSSQP